MNQLPNTDVDTEATLDPPGSIAVIGAGPLGVEAALYGRYLGYDVTLFEADAVGSSMLPLREQPLPMLPNRSLSTLAAAALRAQQGTDTGVKAEAADRAPALPMTVGQWIDNVLVALTESDLLSDRLRIPARVANIQLVPIEPNAEDNETNDIPPDFRLIFADTSPEHDTEAVILATGASPPVPCEFAWPTPYLFRVGTSITGSAEQDLRHGHREIVSIFAGLSGRRDLDLYRPRRI